MRQNVHHFLVLSFYITNKFMNENRKEVLYKRRKRLKEKWLTFWPEWRIDVLQWEHNVDVYNSGIAAIIQVNQTKCREKLITINPKIVVQSGFSCRERTLPARDSCMQYTKLILRSISLLLAFILWVGAAI